MSVIYAVRQKRLTSIFDSCYSSLFLCKEKEEKIRLRPYNGKGKIMCIRRRLMEWVERLNQSMNYIEEHQ